MYTYVYYIISYIWYILYNIWAAQWHETERTGTEREKGSGGTGFRGYCVRGGKQKQADRDVLVQTEFREYCAQGGNTLRDVPSTTVSSAS